MTSTHQFLHGSGRTLTGSRTRQGQYRQLQTFLGSGVCRDCWRLISEGNLSLPATYELDFPTAVEHENGFSHELDWVARNPLTFDPAVINQEARLNVHLPDPSLTASTILLSQQTLVEGDVSPPNPYGPACWWQGITGVVETTLVGHGSITCPAEVGGTPATSYTGDAIRFRDNPIFNAAIYNKPEKMDFRGRWNLPIPQQSFPGDCSEGRTSCGNSWTCRQRFIGFGYNLSVVQWNSDTDLHHIQLECYWWPRVFAYRNQWNVNAQEWRGWKDAPFSGYAVGWSSHMISPMTDPQPHPGSLQSQFVWPDGDNIFGQGTTQLPGIAKRVQPMVVRYSGDFRCSEFNSTAPLTLNRGGDPWDIEYQNFGTTSATPDNYDDDSASFIPLGIMWPEAVTITPVTE